MAEIAAVVGVSKSSVSLWARDVEFTPRPRSKAIRRAPDALQRRKQAEIERLLREGVARVGTLGRKEFLVAGAALYAGEGAKTDGQVLFANTDPRLVAFFCAWLRCFFDVDECRLRIRLYLHQGLDLDEASDFWARLTGIPREQFQKPYRAIPDASLRRTKHVNGCVAVRYGCSRTHRAVMGLVNALLASEALPG
jgi:hypothetical protein